jgi:glycosyltransferase involved in cell wall biosynthesis
MRQQLIERYGPLKSCVPIPNPAPDVTSISLEARAEARQRLRATFGIPRSAYVFVSAGRLTPRKGFDFLIHTFSELTTEDPHLMICGEGESSAQLRRMVLELGLTERVHFTGYVAPIWDYYFASDCFVSSAVFEPFGNVLVEAMACGLPVIGLAGPDDGVETASEEIIRDGEFGYVVRGKNPIALAGRMRTMCRQGPERQALMSRAALNEANSVFSEDAILRKRLLYAQQLRSAQA